MKEKERREVVCYAVKEREREKRLYVMCWKREDRLYNMQWKKEREKIGCSKREREKIGGIISGEREREDRSYDM